MNVVISGYTAAGKTTHARLLAEAMGLEFLSAAELLLERLGFDLTVQSESEIWFRHNAVIDRRRRTEGAVDADLDEYLVDRATRDDGVMFDARFLPWLTGAPMLRVWLDSDLPSRASKCRVSVDAPDIAECAVVIQEKDTLDVRRFADRGRVFGPEPGLFDIVLDNSAFITESTRACAARGVEAFHPYVMAAVEAALGDQGRLRSVQAGDPAGSAAAFRLIRPR